jgi:hypothetical protein
LSALADGDFVTTAVTITGGEFIALEADLGARWKLNRIEYYTDAATASGIAMEISDNHLDFSTVTLTGSAPKYVGDIPDSTISGAPRYIRLTHNASINTLVREWQAINDDTLVDFGPDGNQTEVEIGDAPIGKPSEEVETLTLFNRYNKTATGFVFIDNTNTAADDEIQISASSNGPFFGRTTADGRQPDITTWNEGVTSNTVIVSSGSYRVDFLDGTDKDWTATGFSTATISGGIYIGTTSSFTPSFEIFNSFSVIPADPLEAKSDTRFVLSADDFDRVRVRLRIPTLDPSLVTEGPRLFWRTHEVSSFGSDRSVLSTAGTPLFNNLVQDYIFNVDALPTWSGGVRSLRVQPFTVTSGIGHTVEFHELEVYHSSGQERVRLDRMPVNSGTFPRMDPDSSSTEAISFRAVISQRTVITQPCIITKVKIVGETGTSGMGVFLANISDAADPTVGSNWTVKRVATFADSFSSIVSAAEIDVFWPADVGDRIGVNGANGGSLQYESSDAGDGLWSDGQVRTTDVSTAQSDIDLRTFTEKSNNYLVEYEYVSAGAYLPTGTYKTPIFDGGGPPALLSVDFESEEPTGTSIDSGGDAFKTLRARASDTPPITTASLGERTGPFFLFNDWPGTNNPHDFAINTLNGPVTAREVTSPSLVQNVAGTMFYHEQKEELWVLNVLASGVITNLRPIWDVFDVDTGEYIRTQTVGGPINYGYNFSQSVLEDFIFEPVAFIPDYNKEEIYIIQRDPGFFVGAGQYYGIVLDLDGVFKEAFFRSDTIGEPDEDLLESMGDVAYDGNFFYAITNTVAGSTEREILAVFRNGTNEEPRRVEYIDQVVIDSIPGLTFAQSGNDPKGIAYNTRDGLLYLYFESTVPGEGGPITKAPEFLTLNINPDNSDPDLVTSFSFDVAAVSGTSFDSVPDRFGFRLEEAGSDDDHDVIKQRQLIFTTGITYIESRDSFGVLQTREAIRSTNFRSPNDYVSNFFLFNQKSHSFFVEVGAGNVRSTSLPNLANQTDGIWGTISGSLGFDTITTDSVLFPTGRYAQVEYTLNADPARLLTPYLLSSQITQGLRVGEIPSSGTRNIFLRTNIPDGVNVNDQQGRLKVYWQLEE